MDIVKAQNSKYDEYEALLLERDQLEREAGSIWTSYIKEFGQLMTDVFEEKIECIKRKKMIAYYQSAINHGGQVDQDAMQAYLDQEMAEYNAQLRRMIEDNKKSMESKASSPYTIRRCKEIYRRIARQIHPDTHPGTDQNETLSELWSETVTAYQMNDLKRLSELEVLVNKAIRDMGKELEKIDIPSIEERIEELKEEIEEIKNSEPYKFIYLLDDPEAVAKKKKGLTEELETYIKYRNDLDKVISDLLSNGGITISWRMN